MLILMAGLMLVEWIRGGPASVAYPPSILVGWREGIMDWSLQKTTRMSFLGFLLLNHFLLLWLKCTTDKPSTQAKHLRWIHLDSRDVCKSFLSICTSSCYLADWSAVPNTGDIGSLISGLDQSTNAIVLLTGIVFSQIVELVARRSRLRKFPFAEFGLFILVVFLTGASHLQHGGAFTFKYREEPRWTGLWVNPNTYGLLMGVGFVLALAWLVRFGYPWSERLIAEQQHQDGSPIRNALNSEGKGWIRVIQAVWGVTAAGLLAHGLIHSYSRGAWLGTLAGTLYFGTQTLRTANLSVRKFFIGANAYKLAQLHKLLAGCSRNASVVGLIACSLMIWGTVRPTYSNATVTRRVISVVNANDFSWRNRVVAWEGALRMISDHPVAGLGWHRIRDEFGGFYAPPRLADTWSIILNDFLTLGMALGLPALASFLVLVWLSFFAGTKVCLGGQQFAASDIQTSSLLVGREILDAGSNGQSRVQVSTTSLLWGEAWTVTAARSGLLILLIGFWFEGGMFKFALAAPFWLCLELTESHKLRTHEF